MRVLLVFLLLLLVAFSHAAATTHRELDPAVATAMVYYLEGTPVIAQGWKTLFRLVPPLDVSDLAVAMLVRRLNVLIQMRLTATAADSCSLYADAMERTIQTMAKTSTPYKPPPTLTSTSAFLACQAAGLDLPPWNPPASPQAKALNLATKTDILLRRSPPPVSKKKKKRGGG